MIRVLFLGLIALLTALPGCGGNPDQAANPNPSGNPEISEQQAITQAFEVNANPLNLDLPGTAVDGPSYASIWRDNGTGSWKANHIAIYVKDTHFSLNAMMLIHNISAHRVDTETSLINFQADGTPHFERQHIKRYLPTSVRCSDGHIRGIRELMVAFDSRGRILSQSLSRNAYTRSLTDQLNIFDARNWFGSAFITTNVQQGFNAYTRANEEYTNFNSFALRRISPEQIVVIQVLRQSPSTIDYSLTYYDKVNE